MSDKASFSPKTYDDWLALTPDQRNRVHREWITNRGDGRGIANMAAARLMLEDARILDVRVGIWHGGEYLLEPTVSNDDFKGCPGRFEQVFEGFRVYWHPSSYEFKAADAAHFAGTWTCDIESLDAQYTIGVGKDGFEISGLRPSSNEQLEIDFIAFDGHRLEFQATTPSSRHAALYRIVVNHAHQCERTVVMRPSWKMASGA